MNKNEVLNQTLKSLFGQRETLIIKLSSNEFLQNEMSLQNEIQNIDIKVDTIINQLE